MKAYFETQGYNAAQHEILSLLPVPQVTSSQQYPLDRIYNDGKWIKATCGVKDVITQQISTRTLGNI